MSAQQPFLATNQNGIEEYRISTINDIKSPSYMPEIKSAEDVHAILQHMDALDDNNPIMVPGYRWDNIRTQPAFSQYGTRMQDLMAHPLIYYEPPELFRFAMGGDLVTYALQGSRSKRQTFNKYLRNGDVDDAIDRVPEFFQAFLDRQRKTLLNSDDKAPDPSPSLSNDDISEGWGDPRADRGYDDYYQVIVNNAKKANNAHVVPPVPALRKSSDDVEIRRMRGSNIAMADICDAANFGFGNPVHSYYHVYIDYNFLRSGAQAGPMLIDALEDDMNTGRFAGVVLTVTGYEKAWENNLDAAMEDFVDRVSSIAERHQRPLIMPRSSWFGAYLTDFGSNAFGSLLNGSERYTSGGGLPKDQQYLKYGYVPIYDHADELDIEQFDDHLRNNGGQVHQISGLPDQPPIYNPRGSTFKDKYGTAHEFRRNFSKPRRLLHAQEAREFRDGIKSGLIRPASRYLDRSSHTYLS